MSLELLGKILLDYAKNKVDIFSRADIDTILDRTARQIEQKYGIVSRTNLKEFLVDPDVEKYLECNLATGEIDFKYLAEIFKNYALIPEDQSYETILEEFFTLFEANLANEPKLRDQLFLIRQRQGLRCINALSSDTKKILMVLESLKQFPLEPGNLPSLVKYFDNVIGQLKDSSLDHYVSFDTEGNLEISIKPKYGRGQVERPFHGTLAFKLEKNGKILNFEDMLEEAYRTGTPIIIDSKSLIEFSANYGEVPLIENLDNIEFIKIEPIQPDPIKISVPGCHIQYDIVLKRDEPSTTHTYVFSNRFQNLPIKFKFEYNLGDGGKPINGKFSVHEELKQMDVKQALDISEFMLAASRNGFFVMEKKGKHNDIRLTIRVQGFEPDSQDYINALRKLAFIQDLTSTSIPRPSVISANDLKVIDEMVSYFQTGRIEERCESSYDSVIGKEEASDFLDALESNNGEISGIIESYSEAFFVINGTQIPMGPIEKLYPPMKSKKPVKELLDQLKSTKEDTIDIELVPSSEGNVIIRSISIFEGDSGSINVSGAQQYLIKKWEIKIIKSDPENCKGWAIVPEYHPDPIDIIQKKVHGSGIFRTCEGKAYCGKIEIISSRSKEHKIYFEVTSDLQQCTAP